MRVALMTNNYKPFLGGVPVSVERLALGLLEQGQQVTVFAPTYKGQQEEDYVLRYRTCIKKCIGGTVLPDPFDYHIEEEFLRNHYDIIHVHHPMLIGRTAVRLSRKYHIPLVFTYHTRYEQYLCYLKGIRKMEESAARGSDICNIMLHNIQDKWVPAYLNTFLRNCDFVFTPTKGMQDYLYTFCGLDSSRMDVLPTGLEKEAFAVSEEKKEAVRRRYHAQGMPLLLTVSRMAYEKNVGFLLESLAKVKRRFAKPFRVLAVGEGPQEQEYKKLCRKFGLEDTVIFAGKVLNEDIPPYFAAADAFLFASKTETQGIVVLEAFAGGTPVYAIHATGVSDLVQNGVNGRLTEENSDLYAQRLLDLLEGRDDIAMLSENARRTAMDYREEAVAGKAIHLYNKVIAAYQRNHSAAESRKPIYMSALKITTDEVARWMAKNIIF